MKVFSTLGIGIRNLAHRRNTPNSSGYLLNCKQCAKVLYADKLAVSSRQSRNSHRWCTGSWLQLSENCWSCIILSTASKPHETGMIFYIYSYMLYKDFSEVISQTPKDPCKQHQTIGQQKKTKILTEQLPVEIPNGLLHQWAQIVKLTFDIYIVRRRVLLLWQGDVVA